MVKPCQKNIKSMLSLVMILGKRNSEWEEVLKLNSRMNRFVEFVFQEPTCVNKPKSLYRMLRHQHHFSSRAFFAKLSDTHVLVSLY